MKMIALALFCIAGCTLAANARDVVMTQGHDAYIFDFPEKERAIQVYQIDDGEPYSDEMEGLMHDWFIIEDIYGAMPDLPKDFGLKMGRSAGINNAFAVIFANSRYIVIDPSWIRGTSSRIFVIGHELGHHVCGHTAGAMKERPWDKELEADRFSGAVIRAMEQKGVTTFQDAVGSAMQYLGSFGSATHPPRDMRYQAALDGYNNGSNCLGRGSPTVGVAQGQPHAAEAASLWSHNGSTMRLVANGASRKFVYELPREGMRDAGVTSGSVLFDGRKIGEAYSGTAYIFSQTCGAAGFSVTGPVSTDQRSVTLYGKEPSISKSCTVIGYRNQELRFTFVGQ